MPATGAGRHAAALLGYVCVALAFTCPLPLHLGDAVPGPVGGDTGIYIWNLWLFRHELVEHQRLPFVTFEILALAPPVPLVLHNYTAFANVLAFPLLNYLSPVATYNVLLIASGPAAAYAMFLLARSRVQDDGAAWLAGLLFGFSPFMSARATEHFSLVLSAPLPIFALVLYRFHQRPDARLAMLAGLVVAWAFLCDAYFAVYCLLITAFVAVCSAVGVQPHASPIKRLPFGRVLDVAILSVAGVVAGVLLTGGGRFQLRGVDVSLTNLYTPVLLLTTLLACRLWLTLRPWLAWRPPALKPRHALLAALAVATCAVMLAPVIYAAGSPFGERAWLSPGVQWRSSAPGVDLLAFFAPNPMHPWIGGVGTDWLRTRPNGFIENIASVPWTAILVIAAAAVWRRFRPPIAWIAFTAFFALMAMGPFVHVAGYPTYIPTPWTLLRYLPIVGAARMPTRMAIMVTLCVAMLLAMALSHLRGRSRRPTLLAVALAAILALELLPAPRRMHAAATPSVLRIVAADPRPISVLNLPFGLRDGMQSQGRFTTEAQFHQVTHEKPLVAGYLSRLPRRGLEEYQRHPVTSVLMRLSEGLPADPRVRQRALEEADGLVARLRVGYVIVDVAHSNDALVDFAREAFQLTFVARDGRFELYRTSLE